ncbi:hypothetical protein NVP1139A_57 [Vibrio phage 1.139.A._10N.261.48.C6]|nr:hypothetical protein NVP1139A_57 [Vibrio phage 1.139.A._10N.261.48.C6]AUR90292.1 hypothetical protein NVP1139B_57 [Vibrio phage 1.139.B._10N.261.48.C6]AUR95613.1 hypothetical protein NVP1209O_56 [Vibrio phage 1.209.O._10N.222.52.B2]
MKYVYYVGAVEDGLHYNLCGSIGVMVLDGRWSHGTCHAQAQRFGKIRRELGHQIVGYVIQRGHMRDLPTSFRPHSVILLED